MGWSPLRPWAISLSYGMTDIGARVFQGRLPPIMGGMPGIRSVFTVYGPLPIENEVAVARIGEETGSVTLPGGVYETRSDA